MRWIDIVCMSLLSSTQQPWTVRMTRQPIPSAHFTVLASMAVPNATLGDLAGTREGFLHLLQYGCRFQLTRLQYINSTCATTDSLRGFILPSLASSFCTFFLFAGTKFTHWGPGIGRIAQRDVLHRAYTYAFPRYFLPKTIDTMWYRYCNDTVHTA
jgi:hypothetical protein